LRKAFERFGFDPMETPILEYAETLAGKYGAEEKLMYKFRDNGGRSVAMRYDLTVPLARFYNANRNDLPRPFKRYAIGPVWRAENTQKGRFREFYQCDVDVVGSSSAVADAESIAAVTAALTDLGVKDFAVRINNRKIIDGILETLGVPQKKFAGVLRAFDKLEKQGEKKVKRDLAAGGLNNDQAKKLFAALRPSATSAKGLLDAFGETMNDNKTLSEGVGELADVLDALLGLGVKNLSVDLKLARGLDYYTGTVCEILLSKLPEFGSIAGGGRYDNLIGGLSGSKEKIPAVGMSIGIDRLIEALEELNILKYDLKSDVLIFNMDAKFLPTYLDTVTALRRSGINTELFFEPAGMDKQFKYAEKKKINFAVIIGEEEIESGQVTLKNLVTRKQKKIKKGGLIEELKKI